MTPLQNSQNLNAVGWADAPILVVCEPPVNPADYSAGKVMGDQSMSVFAQMSKAAGFSGEDFAFVTCCPPIPLAEKATAGKTKKYAKQFHSELESFIRAKPNTKMIVYLGSTAGQATLAAEVAITKQRGQVVYRQGWTVPIMGMFSPSHLLKVPDVRELVEIDFNSLARMRQSNWNSEQAFTAGIKNADYKYVFDISDLLENPPPMIAVDTETIGFYRPGFGTAQIITIQITKKAGESYVIPLNPTWWNHFGSGEMFLKMYQDKHKKPFNRLDADAQEEFAEWRRKYPVITSESCAALLAQVKQLLENPSVAVAFHNGQYDIHVLKSLGINVANWCMDTMQAAFAVDENMVDKSLDECTRRWVPELAGYADQFNKTWDKSRMDLIPPWELLDYSGGDTDAAFRLANTLAKLLKEDTRNFKAFMKIQMPTLKAFVKMKEVGVRISTQQLQELEVLAGQSEQTLYTKLISMVPPAVRRKHLDNFGPESLRFSRADFVTDTLFTKEGFNLKPVKFTPATKDQPVKKPSASSNQHLPIFLNFKTPDPLTPGGYPFVENLIQYQKIQKLRSAFIGNCAEQTGFWQYIAPDSRVRASATIHNVITGRSNYRDPNLQQLPKRAKKGTETARLVKNFRKTICASPGYTLIEADESQAELRIIAVMANDPVMLQIYRDDGDIHTMTAATSLGISVEEFLQLPEADRKLFRTYAKAVAFGFSLAKGTLITTSNGLKAIQNIKPDDLLWDGLNWVSHGVVFSKGTKKGITYCGLTASLGHIVFTSEGACTIRFAKAHNLEIIHCPPKNSEVRFLYEIPDERIYEEQEGIRLLEKVAEYGYGSIHLCSAGIRWRQLESNCNLHAMRKRKKSLCPTGALSESNQTMQDLYSRRIQNESRVATCRTLRRDCSAMQNRQSNVQTLRRQGNRKPSSKPQNFCGLYLHKFPKRKLQWLGYRSKRQRRSLRVIKPQSHNSGTQLRKPQELSFNSLPWNERGNPSSTSFDKIFSSSTQFDLGRDVDRTPKRRTTRKHRSSWETVEEEHFDIMDAGPNHRFHIHNVGVVSNCYGMGASKFRDYAKASYELDVTDEQAEEMRAKFFRTYPALEGWHDGMRTFARKFGYVRALHGTLRRLPSINSSDRMVRSETERQAINSTVQRFASDIGLMAVSRLCRDTDWNLVRPLIFIHDAVVCEVRNDVAEQAKGWIKFYMENPPLEKWFNLRLPIPIRSDVSIGNSLGEMEECPGVIAEAPPWFRPDRD